MWQLYFTPPYLAFPNRCGHAEEDAATAAVLLEEHILEFAQANWRNKAFRQMLFGLFPPPYAFREAIPQPPQDLDQPGTLGLLTKVERILGSYAAVRTWAWW